MQQKKKINWWVIAAVIIIGIPVGFVTMGVINKSSDGGEDTPQTDTFEIRKDTLTTIKEDTIQKSIGKSVIQSIVEAGEADCRVPDTCTIVLNGKKTRYRDFRKSVLKDFYSDITVTDMEVHDTIVAKIDVTAKETIKKMEYDAEQERIRQQLRSDVESVVKSGTQDSKVPDNCTIVLNGHNISYKSFREDMARGFYSNIMVRDVRISSRTATKVDVTAEETSTKKEHDAELERIRQQRLEQLRSDVESIVTSGKQDSKVPDNCNIIVNGVNTRYKEFRKEVAKNFCSTFAVTDVKGNNEATKATTVYVSRKVDDDKLRQYVQNVVSSAERDERIPEDCIVVKNNENNEEEDYQSFRGNVDVQVYKAKVIKAEVDAKATKVTRIYVNVLRDKE